MSQLTTALKTPREQLPDRIAELVANLKAAEKQIAAFEAAALAERVPALARERATRSATYLASSPSTSATLARPMTCARS